MPDIRGVILDVDGTLIDSNDAHAHAWVDAFAEFGYHVPFGKVRRLIGMGSDKLVSAAIGLEKTDPKARWIVTRRLDIFKTHYLPHIKAFPGTQSLLKRMHDQGLKLAVATSAKKDELAPLLKIAGATDLIEEKTSSDDVKRSKPDPDIVQAALERLQMPREDTVMIGDTPYDVDAAHNAGIPIIAFRCGGWHDFNGVLAVYGGPADLLAHYEESPLSRSIAARG